MITATEIGGRIAAARKIKNLSQSGLAEELMVSAQAVGKWERGESMPDIFTFSKLAEVLGVDLNYFGGAKMPEPAQQSEEEVPSAKEKSGWNMSGGNWVDADFSGLSGLAEKFNGSNVDKSQFVKADLTGLLLKGNTVRRSDFTEADLRSCTFTGSYFEHTVFTGSNFTGSALLKNTMKNCSLEHADLTDVQSKWSHFQNVQLSDVILKGTVFQLGQLTDMVFDGEITDCAFDRNGFTRVVFDGAKLKNCFFKECNLKKTKFQNCRVDRITYAFLKSCKADLSDVAIVD